MRNRHPEALKKSLMLGHASQISWLMPNLHDKSQNLPDPDIFTFDSPTCKAKIHGPCWAMYRQQQRSNPGGLLICSGGRGAACAGDVDSRGGSCDNGTMQSSGRRGWGVLDSVEVEQQRASSGRNAATSQENLLLLQPKFRSLLAHNYRKILRDEERQQRGPRGIWIVKMSESGSGKLELVMLTLDSKKICIA
ncbi:unnamed protein product [Amoebophrya sp. A120]|nr:unnamed protein product [Amoebophrya sp. A120]CAD7975205.1 unnamed protein product [Amoebophrya sp. A120]|eukprot:GSA120T00000088001.1